MITPIIGKEFAGKVIPLIKSAQKTIDIIVYDWRFYPDQIGSEIQRFNQALIKANRMNIKIRAVTNSFSTISVFKKQKVQMKKPFTKGLMHTKLMIIDNEIAILGSHNYTMNAFTINNEVSVIIRDKEAVERLKKYFNNMWQ